MMPTLEIARCTLTIEATPPFRQYGWVAHGVTPCYSLPFRAPGEREHFPRLLAAYAGPAVAAGAVEDLAALLCLYHGADEAAADLAAHHLDAEYVALLTVTPLEEVDAMVGLLLEEAAVEGALMERESYRIALSAVIAAVYRVLDTWEAGDLAGRVTALGAVARYWDEALGLGVAGRRGERGERDTDEEGEEDTRDV